MTIAQVFSFWPLLAGLAATGVVSGVLAGLLGVGGGAIIVPALALALEALGYGPNIVQHVAVASSLAIIVPTGAASARAHYQRDAVDLVALAYWAPFVLTGCLIGGLMAGLFSGNALRIIFGVMALFIALNVALPIQKQLMSHLSASPAAHRISALLVGYASALMGIGGGSLSVPTLAAFGASMHRAIGTGAAIGVFIAVGGTIGFVISGWNEPDLPPLSLGYVNVIALVLVGALAALTAPIGVALAHRLDQKMLKFIFAAFLVLVGTNMIWKAIAG